MKENLINEVSEILTLRERSSSYKCDLDGCPCEDISSDDPSCDMDYCDFE